MPTYQARDRDGDPVDLPYLNPGRAAAADSKSTAACTEDKAVWDSLDTKLSTLAGYLDTVETLIGSTNTKLDTLAGHVDGLETLITATNTKLDAANASLDDIETQAESTAPVSVQDGGQGEYETVAANVGTPQALGATGAAGDFLKGLIVVPASTSPGAIAIKDGADSAITVFEGGASSVATLHPFPIPLNIFSRTGAWQVTTGANVSVIAVGNFT